MKAKQFLSAILLISIFISCNKAKKDNISDSNLELKKTEADNRGAFELYQTTDTTMPVSSQAPPVKVSNPDWDKKIIKTAMLRLEVPDFKKYNESVHKTIKQYGGYVAGEEQNLSDEKSETTITIKVPVDQFEGMIDQLPGQSVKVLERKITTEDVTGEVVDTRSRLEAKKQMRLKYLDFLKQSKNMEEVLQVQAEINSIQEEIESAAGRINFLSHQASYSTINLTFYQPFAGFKPGDSKPTFFTRLTVAFRSGVEWFADIFVGLMSLWPFILISILAVIIWKRSRVRKPIQQNA
ncbi:MAG: DUF4349 domain-containing protein [Ferruginibacter sp.]